MPVKTWSFESSDFALDQNAKEFQDPAVNPQICQTHVTKEYSIYHVGILIMSWGMFLQYRLSLETYTRRGQASGHWPQKLVGGGWRCKEPHRSFREGGRLLGA